MRKYILISSVHPDSRSSVKGLIPQRISPDELQLENWDKTLCEAATLYRKSLASWQAIRRDILNDARQVAPLTEQHFLQGKIPKLWKRALLFSLPWWTTLEDVKVLQPPGPDGNVQSSERARSTTKSPDIMTGRKPLSEEEQDEGNQSYQDSSDDNPYTSSDEYSSEASDSSDGSFDSDHDWGGCPACSDFDTGGLLPDNWRKFLPQHISQKTLNFKGLRDGDEAYNAVLRIVSLFSSEDHLNPQDFLLEIREGDDPAWEKQRLDIVKYTQVNGPNRWDQMGKLVRVAKKIVTLNKRFFGGCFKSVKRDDVWGYV